MTQIAQQGITPDPAQQVDPAKQRSDALAAFQTAATDQIAALSAALANAQNDIAALQADPTLPIPDSIQGLPSIAAVIPNTRIDRLWIEDFSDRLNAVYQFVQTGFIKTQFEANAAGNPINRSAMIDVVTDAATQVGGA